MKNAVGTIPMAFFHAQNCPRRSQKSYVFSPTVSPKAPPTITRQMGVYVPTMSRKMEQWSNTWNTALPLERGRAWYRQEIRYRRIIDTPKTVTLTRFNRSPMARAWKMRMMVPTMPSSAPRPWVTALSTSSPMLRRRFSPRYGIDAVMSGSSFTDLEIGLSCVLY